MRSKMLTASLFALLAAAFYAINMPLSKLLLTEGRVAPTMMAALLYLGAGIGIGILFFSAKNRPQASQNLDRSDLPAALGMILLDIGAPIFLMLGLKSTASASASLLNNFEIAATALIALLLFKEAISPKLWAAIALVTLSSILLSVEDLGTLTFTPGSLFVLLAALCWGLENNCTRRLSSKNTYQIVMLKGIFSGLGSLGIALLLGESLPDLPLLLAVLGLGFVAYGLSITFYIKAQFSLGAAKTSAYYAIAPFIGTLLSFLLLQEPLTKNYLPAFFIMLLGSALLVWDTLSQQAGELG